MGSRHWWVRRVRMREQWTRYRSWYSFLIGLWNNCETRFFWFWNNIICKCIPEFSTISASPNCRCLCSLTETALLQAKAIAQKRYDDAKKIAGGERLVSGERGISCLILQLGDLVCTPGPITRILYFPLLLWPCNSAVTSNMRMILELWSGECDWLNS